MPFERINEGLGDLASNIGGAIKTDIMKGSGPWESMVDALLKNPLKSKQDAKKNVDEIPKKIQHYKPVIPDYAQKQKEHLTFKKFSSTNKIDDVLKYLKDIKAREELYAYWRWSFYIDMYLKKVNKDISTQTILFDIVMNIKEDKMKIEKIHYDEIFKLIQDYVVSEVESNKSKFDAQVKKMPKTENIMSFKQFHEAQEKKLKEGTAETDQKNAINKKVKAATADAEAAKAEAKATMSAAKQKEIAAKNAAKSPVIAPMAEGTYAGGDGVKKKIPFTQNSTLQNQAVGPKDPDAKDKEEEDDELSAAKERIKKLEKLTKELQKAADESNEVATDNIDATADTLIDKMAARERDELKEAASDWKKMEAQLKQLDEGCVGGVCTMGGRADVGASGPMGSFGIAPMGQIGGLSMPLPMEQNPVPQVADRSTIYNFVKNNDLHRTNRDFALNALTDKFGNASTELSAILSDAILSDGDPEGIDQSYGYSPDSLLAVQAPPEDEPVNDHIAQATQMSNAWGQMEEKLKDL